MLHAHDPAKRGPDRAPRKRTPSCCQYPGCNVMTRGYPQRYCPPHAREVYLENKRKSDSHRQNHQRKYKSEEAKDTASVLRLAAKVKVIVRVEVRPGYCTCCGVIRLSQADTGGICDGCRTDK